jgi:hypothetical protein
MWTDQPAWDQLEDGDEGEQEEVRES